jgi:hypothetical protein
MKCPHCNTGIAEKFAATMVINDAQVNDRLGNVVAPGVTWTASHQRCPECHEFIIFLNRTAPPHMLLSFLAHPSSRSRQIAAEVVDPYRQDFLEASKVLADSPKASAALSRRCLQAILKDKAGTTKKDLNDQIEEVIASQKVPGYIAEGLHAVRNIGNFAAHPMKSTATGVIIDVEPGEAEWNLDVLESLFEFYFVQPALDAKRKAELNKKLKAAGKPELP